MADMKNFDEKPQSVVFKTPPKMAFIIGILAGITLTSLVAFIMTYSLLRTKIEGNENANSNQVAQANTNTAAVANTNTAPVKADIQVKATDNVEGDKNAAVTLVEYSDFECSYCSALNTTLEQIMTEYKGKVKLVYRHFPLTSIHQNAQKAAEAAECAGAQGKFWAMHDKLFANQSALAVTNLKTYAKDIGLNTTKFNDCLDNGTTAARVASDQTEGESYGVNGTPATFINGTLVSGALPYASFKTAIDAALAK
ncbi:MAG: thioredoxin domain-containing protein [Patescibacteria group bacterium]